MKTEEIKEVLKNVKENINCGNLNDAKTLINQLSKSLQKEQPKEQGAEEFFKKWSNGMPLSFVMENKDLCIDLLTEYAQQLNNVPTDEEIEKEAEKFFKKRSHQEVHGGDLVLSESAFDDYIDKILKNK